VRSLTDDTPVPLRWVAYVLAVSGAIVVSAVAVGSWITNIEQALAQNTRRLENIEKIQSQLGRIDHRLSNIEGRLGISTESSKNE
jgi:hypothetical protein